MNNMLLIKRVLKEALLLNFRPHITHVILHVTSTCNMSCKHCFVPTNNRTQDLTVAEIKAILSKLPDIIWLDIGGGEPLLRDDFEEIVGLLHCQELSIPTNGWDTAQIVRRIKSIRSAVAGKLIVTLSLEGAQKTHDEIRCPGSFERTIQTFEELKKIEGVRVKFNTVLSDRNCDEVVDLMHFVKQLHPDFHSIIMLRGSPRSASMKLPSLAKIKKMKDDICAIQQSYDYGRKGILSRIQRNYQAYKQDLVLSILEEHTQVIPCLAGVSHLVVWADGNVAPCELLPSVGNIREKSLEDILAGEEMQKAIMSIKDKKCFCTHDCNMIENVLLHPTCYGRLMWPRKGR